MLGDSEERRDLETRMRSFLLSHFARLRTGQIFSINNLFADGFFCNINILNFCGAEYRWKHVYSELTRYTSVRKRHLLSQRRAFLENLLIEIIP